MRTFIDLLIGLSLTRDHGRGGWLAARADVGEGDRVLDIGCGPGNGLLAATKRGATAIGLDPSPTMLGLAARRAPGALLLPASVEAIPLPCDSINVAWASGSFHHWPDPGAGLAEVARVLEPGGRVFIVERRATARGFHAKHAISHPRAEQLVDELGSAGFANATLETPLVGNRDLLVVSASAAGQRDRSAFRSKRGIVST